MFFGDLPFILLRRFRFFLVSSAYFSLAFSNNEMTGEMPSRRLFLSFLLKSNLIAAVSPSTFASQTFFHFLTLIISRSMLCSNGVVVIAEFVGANLNETATRPAR
jgi:hypothetical protein